MYVDSAVSCLSMDVAVELVAVDHSLDTVYQFECNRENVADLDVPTPDPMTIRSAHRLMNPTVVLDFAMEYLNLVSMTSSFYSIDSQIFTDLHED